jgi:hypothetical protein
MSLSPRQGPPASPTPSNTSQTFSSRSKIPPPTLSFPTQPHPAPTQLLTAQTWSARHSSTLTLACALSLSPLNLSSSRPRQGTSSPNPSSLQAGTCTHRSTASRIARLSPRWPGGSRLIPPLPISLPTLSLVLPPAALPASRRPRRTPPATSPPPRVPPIPQASPPRRSPRFQAHACASRFSFVARDEVSPTAASRASSPNFATSIFACPIIVFSIKQLYLPNHFLPRPLTNFLSRFFSQTHFRLLKLRLPRFFAPFSHWLPLRLSACLSSPILSPSSLLILALSFFQPPSDQRVPFPPISVHLLAAPRQWLGSPPTPGLPSHPPAPTHRLGIPFTTNYKGRKGDMVVVVRSSPDRLLWTDVERRVRGAAELILVTVFSRLVPLAPKPPLSLPSTVS